MIYKPHLLLIYKEGIQEFDEDLNPIIKADTGKWIPVCQCRCDDSGVTKRISVNGEFFDFSFHVVYTGHKIAPNTKIRCVDKNGDIRGEGVVIKSNVTNKLKYAELWV